VPARDSPSLGRPFRWSFGSSESSPAGSVIVAKQRLASGVYGRILSLVLSPESVVRAGVESVQQGGLSSLGIRALAQRLGVTPMALYRHVDTAEALERAVVDAVLEGVPAVVRNAEFICAARAWAEGARPVLAAHPGVARHVLTNWFRLPRVLDWIEALLAAAERTCMTGPFAVAAVNAVFTYVLMRVEAEDAVRAAGVIRRKLPKDAKSEARWPRLMANTTEYEVARLDRHFAFGLETLLRGMDGRNHAGA
jgi:AcrR family transcriptional regulator